MQRDYKIAAISVLCQFIGIGVSTAAQANPLIGRLLIMGGTLSAFFAMAIPAEKAPAAAPNRRTKKYLRGNVLWRFSAAMNPEDQTDRNIIGYCPNCDEHLEVNPGQTAKCKKCRKKFGSYKEFTRFKDSVISSGIGDWHNNQKGFSSELEYSRLSLWIPPILCATVALYTFWSGSRLTAVLAPANTPSQQPAPNISAPNGIAVGVQNGGTNTVNNFGPKSVVIQPKLSLGNLKQRAVNLAQEAMSDLYLHGWPYSPSSGFNKVDPFFKMPQDPEKRHEWELHRSVSFKFRIFERMIAINNEFSQLHYSEPCLDEFIKINTHGDWKLKSVYSKSPDGQLVMKNVHIGPDTGLPISPVEIEDAAKCLKALSDKIHVDAKD